MKHLIKRLISGVLLMSLFFSYSLANKPDGVNEAVDAQTVSQIKVPNSPEGFFFRGDSRPPSIIFDQGFHPQGNNADLTAHLSFRGDSAYVSTSRSNIAAQRYMFGRTGSSSSDGYLYVIAPDNIPRGYWIPGIYPNDNAVQNNMEYAVWGSVQQADIAGAFHYIEGSSTPAEWIPNPDYLYSATSPYVPSTDGFFQDICNSIAVIAAYLCFKQAG